jgi:hypothetical protein
MAQTWQICVMVALVSSLATTTSAAADDVVHSCPFQVLADSTRMHIHQETGRDSLSPGRSSSSFVLRCRGSLCSRRDFWLRRMSSTKPGVNANERLGRSGDAVLLAISCVVMEAWRPVSLQPGD